MNEVKRVEKRPVVVEAALHTKSALHIKGGGLHI